MGPTKRSSVEIKWSPEGFWAAAEVFSLEILGSLFQKTSLVLVLRFGVPRLPEIESLARPKKPRRNPWGNFL